MSSIVQSCESGKLPLAAAILRSGGSISLRALGMSMLPTIWPGDVVTIESRPPESILPGEIVLYENKDRFFIHRVIENRDPARIITRGDSMPVNDLPIAAHRILGRVSEVRRNRRTIIPPPRLSFVNQAIGLLFCHSDIFRNLALRFHTFRSRSRQNSPATSGLASVKR